MKPVLPLIALVDVKPQEKYEIGDIVLFFNNGNILLPRYCHRIIHINEYLFTAKGDNRKKSDEYEIDVPVKNIEGKIIGFKKII